jgi:2-polyprenyl-3-methyl-5-hydroxy-6-metoxy-1,4-benzoquinol methylase
MAEAGVKHVFFGVESANDAIRNTVTKGITKDEVRRAVALAKKYHIDTAVAFIVGLPGETEESVTESMDFVRELQPYEAGFSTAIPFPGSPLRAWAAEKGFLDDARLEALQPGRAVMRTEALSCREIEALRHKAEHETVAFTTRSTNTAEAQCDHLVATLLDFERREETASAVPSVMLALSRASLDVHVGWEPCIWQAERLLGGELSVYHQAKTQAMLGLARALYGQPGQAAVLFHAAESAGFPEVSTWCREKYVALGWGEHNLLPQSTTQPIPPSDLTTFAAALRQLGEPPAKLFITGLPEDADNALAHIKHKAFASLEILLDALRKQAVDGEEHIVWIHGAFSRPATEAESFEMLRSCRAVSGANTLWVFYDSFGPQRGDMLRNQPKHVSRGRALELADMAGFHDVTSVDACLIAVGSLGKAQEGISPFKLLILRNTMTDVEYKQYVLDAQEKIQRSLTTMDNSVHSGIREDMARLVADNAYNLLLRYACATAFDLEDQLYTASRAVDYHAFGQWQLDYATMIRDALDLEGEKLLDFGCAYGTHVLGFRIMGIDACGVDVNREFIRNALPSVAGHLRHFPITNPSALLKMFSPRSFTAILATEVFEHVPHEAKKEYIRIFAQLLTPGGSCIITCPTGEQAFENLHGGGVFADPQHAHLITDAQLVALFADAGFADTSDDYRAHVRSFQGKDGFSFWRTYGSFDRYFCFRVPGERRRKTSAARVRAYAVAARAHASHALMRGTVWSRCKGGIKQCLLAVNALATRVLPKPFKERLKSTALGVKFRNYLHR